MAGGEFLMGSDEAYSFEAPAHTVTVPPFEMMNTEVTASQYELCYQAQVDPCPEAGTNNNCNFQVAGSPVNGWAHSRR